MFYINPQETLSLMLSIQYTYNKDCQYDYSTEPRYCNNLVLMLKGKGLIKSDGKLLTANAGDVLFIPKNTTYFANWFANPNVVFHTLHFSFQPKIDPFINKNIPIQLLKNDNFDELYSLTKKIERYQFSKDENSFLSLSAFFEICGSVFNQIKLLPSKPINKTILPSIRYVEDHYAEQINVEKLASLCFLSSSRFFYLFKKQTGMSPIVYKNTIAIQRAAQDLLYNKEYSIAEIAERHGFSSLIYFERIFKKVMNKSPSIYRKENTLL